MNPPLSVAIMFFEVTKYTCGNRIFRTSETHGFIDFIDIFDDIFRIPEARGSINIATILASPLVCSVSEGGLINTGHASQVVARLANIIEILLKSIVIELVFDYTTIEFHVIYLGNAKS